MGVAATAADLAFIFGHDRDSAALEHPGARRQIEQSVGDGMRVQNHQISLLADRKAVLRSDSDSPRRVTGAHLENVGLMFGRAELDEVSEQIADLQGICLAEGSERVANVVGGIGDVDACSMERPYRRQAAPRARLVTSSAKIGVGR